MSKMNHNQYNNDKVFKPFVAAQCSEYSYRQNLYNVLGTKLQGLKILDMGCGTGLDLAHLIKLGAEAYGLDISTKMAALARQKLPEAKITVGDMNNLPYKDNMFDLVYCQFVMVHEIDLTKIFTEVHRVLKSGGYFVILATHPTKQFIEKGKQNYFEPTEYTDIFFENTVSIQAFSHIFNEYFSPFMLKNFKLDYFEECPYEVDQQVRDILYPGYVIMKFKKL